MSNKIVLLTQWFDPEPTFKGLVFAKELVLQGFKVEVVTGFPNYPSGKIYDGYKIKFIQKEFIDGVSITRLPLYPSHNNSKFKRIANYLSFSVSALFYCLFFLKRPNVIYAYHPPLTIGLVAVFIRFFRRIPVIYDIQDMWPDTLSATGMIKNKQILAIISFFCDWVYKKVDDIVTLSPGFKRLLINRGVSESKISIIYNWCDESCYNKSIAKIDDPFHNNGKFKVLFAGNIGKAQALESVIIAAQLLIKEKNICFYFLGSGIELEDLKKKSIEKQLSNVLFLPQVSMEESFKYLYFSDTLLVHLKNEQLFKITIPSKTQAYMAVGKPIIMAVLGDAADIIIQANCGALAEPENPESIKNAILQLYHLKPSERELLAKNSKKYYSETFSLSQGVKLFGGLFRKYCAKSL